MGDITRGMWYDWNTDRSQPKCWHWDKLIMTGAAIVAAIFSGLTLFLELNKSS